MDGMTQGKDQDSKENNWKEREEKLENGGDNALDNNNTIDKSKNGNVGNREERRKPSRKYQCCRQ